MNQLFAFQIIALLAGLIVLPAEFLYGLWRHRSEPLLKWLLQASYTGGFIVLMFFIGAWDWVSYYLRYAAVGAYVLVAAAALVHRRRRAATAAPRRGAEQAEAGEKPAFPWGELLPALIFVPLLAWTLSGFRYAGEPVRLTFPLKDGWYYVRHGGTVPLLNYHTTYAPQRYTLDIVALNSFGARAKGMYPSDLGQYVIFGHTVYSPCDGVVTHVVDGLPDASSAAPAGPPEHPAGNHVVISCDGVNVVLAHFQRDTIRVAPDMEVAAGEPLGQVGNSGNSTEPHLHVHAVRPGSGDPLDGEAAPILFDDAFLVRNSTWRR